MTTIHQGGDITARKYENRPRKSRLYRPTNGRYAGRHNTDIPELQIWRNSWQSRYLGSTRHHSWRRLPGFAQECNEKVA